jgi:hypothetical protein
MRGCSGGVEDLALAVRGCSGGVEDLALAVRGCDSEGRRSEDQRGLVIMRTLVVADVHEGGIDEMGVKKIGIADGIFEPRFLHLLCNW